MKTEYKIITGYWVKPKMIKQPSLESEVNRYIEEGWEIVGAPFVINPTFPNPVLAQAIIKRVQ